MCFIVMYTGIGGNKVRVNCFVVIVLKVIEINYCIFINININKIVSNTFFFF